MSAQVGASEGPGPQATSAARPVGFWFENMSLNRSHLLAALALFMAFVIESWEQLALVYVSGDLGDAFAIDEGRIGWVLSAVALGMIPGSLVWGPVSDRIGRRAVCLWSLAAYGVIALASALAPNFTLLMAARFLSGLALAGIYTVTFPYFLELLPTKSRGRAAVYLSIGWPIGVLLAVGATQLLGDMGWHVVAVASALAGLWVFAIRAWVPESPYWLAQQGRHDDAAAVLRRLGADVPQGTVFEVVEPELAGRPVELFRGRLLKTTVLMLVVNFAFNWGYWGLQTWLPTLLQDKGLSMSASLGFVALSAVFMIPGYVSASYLTGRFGRKRIFLPYVALAAVAGIAFAYSDTLTEMYVANFALSFFSLGAWGVWNTWNGEFYPTALRATGYSWATAAQLGATSLAPSVVGYMLARATGYSSTILFIMGFLAVALVFAVPLPETEGRDLE
ncbi:MULTISPECIES: MFS transporter [unclassified Streptomyces]|uniref:MFS transporter n=1 Tax=unclassified Streptomyces TaxID=2593676 RepID=UPI00225B0DA7|nr:MULTISPECIES: MFS transporter [unclassified Streptomyces]MCX5138679.1 MFS transporter [Streptomyces sp. NBC_00338]WRZ63360.1 MFS transporter [Streptomyces sp. NBC_01257]WSU57323.1 MFS transporter [Streptomyces sp. NBC_01104]